MGMGDNADEGSSWDALHATYEMKRVNHEEAYSFRRRLHELGRGIFQPNAPCAHWTFRLVPDFTAAPRFASRRSTVSARAALRRVP
jgi:hypothetical protein